MAGTDGQEKPSTMRGKRGGLGRGLGALIPQADRENGDSHERPLDVLLPDLQGRSFANGNNGEYVRAVRGGSARELLNPRNSKHKIVSRETISSEATADGVGVGEREHDVVSRETISKSSVQLQMGIAEELDETHADSLLAVPGTSFGVLPVSSITRNIRQPRQVFDQSELVELAESIREVGLLQPIVVRPVEERFERQTVAGELPDEKLPAGYELVMGERRFRAAVLAGLEGIPAIIRKVDDDQLLRDALIENLHRVQLNPLEEAAAYAQLMDDFSCTQEELSRRIARSRPQIANTIRLLKLPTRIQNSLASGDLSSGHARALLSLPNPEAMQRIGDRIISEGLSVRATEQLVRTVKQSGEHIEPKRTEVRASSPLAQGVANLVSGILSAEVKITEGKTRGRIVITFTGSEDLERIAQILGHVPDHKNSD